MNVYSGKSWPQHNNCDAFTGIASHPYLLIKFAIVISEQIQRVFKIVYNVKEIIDKKSQTIW